MTAVAEQLDRRNRRTDRTAWLWQSAWSKQSSHGLVLSAQRLTGDTGANVLKTGVNTPNAAVAGALARNDFELAESKPSGMATALSPGIETARPVITAGACTAPATATQTISTNPRHHSGNRAVAFPGADADWSELHTRFRGLPRQDIARAAIELPRQGHLLNSLQHELASAYAVDQIAADAANLTDKGRITGHGKSLCDGAVCIASRR